MCIRDSGFPSPVDAVRPEGDFQRFAPGTQLQKFLGFLAFFFQRAYSAFQLAQDVPQAFQIVRCRRQPPLRLIFAVAVFGNAACLLYTSRRHS